MKIFFHTLKHVAIAALFALPSLNTATPIPYNLVDGLPNIYITSATEAIGHTWEHGVVWDKPLISKFYNLMAEKAEPFVVLDIGAQTGSFSLLAKFLPLSKWYSFEPIEEAISALNENLILNDIQNVSLHQMAVSNTRETKTLKMPPQNAWGLATIGDECIRFQPVSVRTIHCVDLDTFVQEQGIAKVDFIKIDTEGWEYFVLQGAMKLILRDRPIILMEYNETNMSQCHVVKQQIDDLLYSIDYQWELVSSEDVLCTPYKL